ncbi:MAG: DegT/DnrJ/EryC1/StrS family aminotransferase [Verrucomicrobia bacterium]|nr:DegT/DnrJ/EryC1/StrS family aminotransferase [Verrucomicrobiota bacterium]MDA1005236.1 DegT/DnrJ/EryC1/StrS family aminotransferase [Verrucomicrobiota bacterium]
MKVPLIDVALQNGPLKEELEAAFAKVLASGYFILGPELEGLERELAEQLGVKHAIGVSSGTDALLLAFMALGLGPGDEVLCPGFTFFATAGCIARTGARPVFTDVCPVCFNIDLDSARAKLTERTKAIVPVHLFGQAAEMDGVMALAKEHGLFVVEDTAQAIGARYRGKACGTMGEYGAYSFFPTKNLGGFGDGGLVVTNDDALAEKARIYRMHGMQPKYYHKEVGGNFRMDAVQAALLRVKVPHLAGYNAARARNAARYVEQLSGLPGVAVASEAHCGCLEAQSAALPEGTKLILPVAYGHNEHTWNQFTVRVPGAGNRDALQAHLQAAGIGCEVYYPVSLHQQECFADLPEHSRSGLPVSELLCGEVLSLPVFPELTREQQDHVIAEIGKWVG